jgi:DNA-binding HxlR family transcriptional regulator
VVTGPVPASVIYRLTSYGTTVLPVVERLGRGPPGPHHGETTDEGMGCAYPVA